MQNKVSLILRGLFTTEGLVQQQPCNSSLNNRTEKVASGEQKVKWQIQYQE
jgi:hypothetical protein